MEEILNKLPLQIRNQIRSLPRQAFLSIEEIRIRVGFPIVVLSGKGVHQIGTSMDGGSGVVSQDLLLTILNAIISYSLHAVQEELSQGFVTLKGGHRIGICGRAIIQNGDIQAIKDISSLNIRRGREIKGISDTLMQYIYRDKAQKPVRSTLIVSPPKCGKTTLLRDIIRNLSTAQKRVGLVDERSEIAAVSEGVPQYDLGLYTDVLDGCPKEKGIMMMIRAMAPEVIATDEIGKPEDVYAVETALCAGISIITTIHGFTYEDLLASGISPLIQKGVFERLIYLSAAPVTGTVSRITDGENHDIAR